MDSISRTILTSLLLISAPGLGRISGADVIAPPSNAALQYWRGFAAMPSRESNGEDSRILADWETVPLDSRVEQLLERCRPSLDLIVRGTQIKECDWGLTLFEDGPSCLVPHLVEARNASTLLCLRARFHLERGSSGAASNDLVAALTLSRHLGAGEATIISSLVGQSIETRSAETLSRRISRMDPATLKEFSNRLNRLPHRAPLDKLLQAEDRALVDWLRRKIRVAVAEGRGPSAVQELSQMLDAESRKVLLKAELRPEQVVTDLGEVSETLSRLSACINAPPAEFETKSSAILGGLRPGNLWATLLMPSIRRLYASRAEEITRFALLETAIAIQVDGAGALSKHTDPVTGSTIERAPLERGYELRSPGIPGEKPVSLKVNVEP